MPKQLTEKEQREQFKELAARALRPTYNDVSQTVYNQLRFLIVSALESSKEDGMAAPGGTQAVRQLGKWEIRADYWQGSIELRWTCAKIRFKARV